MIMAGTFVLGPIIGGFLTLVDWRLNFFLNVPIGIIAAYMAWKYLRKIKEFKGEESFDMVGKILFAIAFITLTIYGSAGFISGFFSPEILVTFMIGVVSLAAFIR
ncbi:hypothetical protein DLD82_17820 [Methanospirillum stamsii]|uniref:Major facilitator superfamily (MFS) profile domain-containing protein n=1 Tax=Methanospirillum stamsii TaxID=1277351 RepID=A0A2V2MYW8_9EURY|nr:hypothetical protein DLD82_17820 [Methanospirillum stamsii]